MWSIFCTCIRCKPEALRGKKWQSRRTWSLHCLLYKVLILVSYCRSSATQGTAAVTVQTSVLTFFSKFPGERGAVFPASTIQNTHLVKNGRIWTIFFFPHLDHKLRPFTTNITRSNHLTQRDLPINYLTCAWLMIFSKIQH